ncbi:MAG: hypothetical protein RLP14_05380 [Owenweeksia sp.]
MRFYNTYTVRSLVHCGSNPFILLLVFAIFSLHPTYAQPGNPVFGLTSEMGMAVDMQAIAIFDIETSSASSDLGFTLSAPAEAGEALDTSSLTNSSNWINYSCADRDVSSRHIEVSIGAGSVPPGLELLLSTGNCVGGAGNQGTPFGSEITLSAVAQEIISGIQGCFTGNGSGNGHQLTYRLRYINTNFNQIGTQTTPVTIVYTMLDD